VLAQTGRTALSWTIFGELENIRPLLGWIRRRSARRPVSVGYAESDRFGGDRIHTTSRIVMKST